MRVNAASLDIRDATTSTPGTLNDLTTDLIMANNNNNSYDDDDDFYDIPRSGCSVTTCPCQVRKHIKAV